jgi:hypothetical protein
MEGAVAVYTKRTNDHPICAVMKYPCSVFSLSTMNSKTAVTNMNTYIRLFSHSPDSWLKRAAAVTDEADISPMTFAINLTMIWPCLYVISLSSSRGPRLTDHTIIFGHIIDIFIIRRNY